MRWTARRRSVALTVVGLLALTALVAGPSRGPVSGAPIVAFAPRFVANTNGIIRTIGNNVLIANDVPESMGRVNENENRSKIAVTTESKEEADRIFNGLSAGGTVEMPMAESPWGTHFAMFRDKYGIEWTVEFTPKE